MASADIKPLVVLLVCNIASDWPCTFLDSRCFCSAYYILFTYELLLTITISLSFWCNISPFIGHKWLEKTINETHNQYFYYAKCHRNIKINFHNYNHYPLLYKQMEIFTSSLGRFLECWKCNMLVVTQAPWYVSPQASGIHIRQSTHACVTTITWGPNSYGNTLQASLSL